MTRKKQVIEILEKYSVKRVYFNSDDSICAERINVRDEVVDTILALPLDVPSDEEIDKQVDDDFCFNSPMYVEGVKKGMKAMRDEILKRNK